MTTRHDNSDPNRAVAFSRTKMTTTLRAATPLANLGDAAVRGPKRSAPRWLWVATVALLLLALSPHLPAPLNLNDDTPYLSLVWGLLRGGGCAAWLWAASRIDLDPQLRQALRLLALTGGLGAVATFSFLPSIFGGEQLLPQWAYRVLVMLTYVTGLAAVLRMPMVPVARARWHELVIDSAASAAGILVVGLVLAWPALVAPDPDRLKVFTPLVAQTLQIIALNVLVLRGVARPSRRALWLLATNAIANLVTAIIYSVPGATSIGISCAVLTSLVTLWAARAFHDDAIGHDLDTPVPAWLRTFNPLPALVALIVGVLLIRETLQPSPLHAPLLGATLLGITILLTLRAIATAVDNQRLVALQTARDRAAEEARVEALTKLTGGIAHWFNNLLMVVIGNAEVSQDELRRRNAPLVSRSLDEIRAAAERAARLTRQMLAYAGRQPLRKRPVELNELATAVAGRLPVPTTLSLVVEAWPTPVWIDADRPQIEVVLEELIANARHAMHDTGAIVVRVSSHREPGTTDAPAVARDEHPAARLEVRDNGPGASHEVLMAMFDPFFTTRGPTQAAGLGLSAVRGIVELHGGTIRAHTGTHGGMVITMTLPQTG